MNETSDTYSLDPAKLLADANRHRLVLQATLAPVSGDRFQPAGFPEIGHVIYKAPRLGRTTEEVCIVDSAASMANHLEMVCHASPFALDLHEDLTSLPHVECWTDDKEGKPERLVVTSLSEGHRLASSYFVSDTARTMRDGKPGSDTFISELKREFGMKELGNKTHPLPGDWWNVFNTIFSYDPNSLVHGILFPSLGIKIPRVLTASLEAFGAARVSSSGVKFDKLGKTESGQPIFAVDEETATEIRATFVLDLSLLRSFGRDKNGLTTSQKQLLLELAFWKIHRMLAAPFRFRSNCDLELKTLTWVGADVSNPKAAKNKPVDLTELSVDIKATISKAYVDPRNEPTTKVYWPSTELFRLGNETEVGAPADESGEDGSGADDEE